MENYAKMAKELSEKNGDLFGEADLESEFVRIENERDLDFDRSSVRKLKVRIVLRSGKQNQEDEKTIENESLLRQEPEEEPTDKEEKKPKANEDKKPEANEEKKPKVVSKPKVVFKGQKKVIFKEKI
jgi:septum formation inhibitor MinC